MEAMEPPLLTQTRGQVAVLTLNRPGRLNAIGRDVLALLAAAVAEAAIDGHGILVLEVLHHHVQRVWHWSSPVNACEFLQASSIQAEFCDALRRKLTRWLRSGDKSAL